MERKLLGTFVTIFLILSLTSFIPLTYDDDTVDKAAGTDIRVMNFNLHFGVEVNVGYKLDGFREVILDHLNCTYNIFIVKIFVFQTIR